MSVQALRDRGLSERDARELHAICQVAQTWKQGQGQQRQLEQRWKAAQAEQAQKMQRKVIAPGAPWEE